MTTKQGVRSPRQFKASIGPRGRRKQRRKLKAGEQEPIPVLPRSPASKAIAPYSPGSELEDSYLRFLIYHCMLSCFGFLKQNADQPDVTVVCSRTLTCVGPRFEWYPLAVRDDAFFHSLMSSTSSHAAYLQQVELPRNFYHHRGIAIRLLNERLERGDHDEGTINTVCVFAQQEAFEGRPRTASTHITGLLQLVKASGGIEGLSYDPKTRRHVHFTDLAGAITLSTKPVLEPTLDISDYNTYFGQPTSATVSYAQTFRTRLCNFTNSPLSDQAATALWGLRNLTQLRDDFHSGDAFPDTLLSTDLQFTDRVEVLERLVHQLWYVEDSENEQHAIFRTFGWTCVIYIYIVLRELPKELGMNTMLAGRIKATLEAYPDLNVLLATFNDLFLWQMFVCGRVADERDRNFFASHATKILIIRKLEDANDILVAAEAFLWPERHVSSAASSSSASRLDSEMVDIDD
ncbi:hypothetical protein LSUE1_G007748 [Lachnellula suecica]|uniref:Uncharacterized protein n=1 Tax=Lachnellula suecica TaxID=602035 RepID=A0A8T9BT37_9HELO|nr:hypothetical protein LSUE1_G007748 [Lachnellula suecica]